MLNYEHEIHTTKDIKIKKFLWCDYFHDSILKEIKIENGGKDIFIRLLCSREWDNIDNSISYDINNDICDYWLHFSGCLYFENLNISKDINEFLNGRFKNSGKLKKLSNTQSKSKKFYHFRIQFTSGPVDIIFNKFDLKRIHGEILGYKRIKISNYFDTIREKYSKYSLKELLDFSENGEWFERLESLEYLYLINYSELKPLVIKNLNDEDLFIASVFILGEIGDFDDIKYLKNTLIFIKGRRDSSRIFFEKQIQDSIEKILYKYELGEN